MSNSHCTRFLFTLVKNPNFSQTKEMMTHIPMETAPQELVVALLELTEPSAFFTLSIPRGYWLPTP